MNNNDQQIREALTKIANLAKEAINGDEHSICNQDGGHKPVEHDYCGDLGCTVKSLPKRLRIEAAKVAMKINPVNGPVFGPVAEDVSDLIINPQHIAVMTAKYWGATPRQLTVSFMESIRADLRDRIISHLNAWTLTGSIEFVYTQGIGQIRISRGSGGYFSYSWD